MSFGELPHTRIQGEASRCSAPSPSTFVRVPYFRFSPPCQTSRFPWSSCSRATLPTRSEQLLNNLRFLPRELHPQSVNGLRSLGFDANLCADLNSFKADRNVDTPLILALFINEFFKAAGSDYAASQSIAKYLRRRARKIDVEPSARRSQRS